MNRRVAIRTDVRHRHLHYFLNAKFVDIVHREAFDVVFFQNPPFALVDISQTDVHQLFWFHPFFVEPGKAGHAGAVLDKTHEESERHAVNIACIGRLWRVDVLFITSATLLDNK